MAKYVASMATLPQLTPPGTQFACSNAALILDGHVIEAVTGKPYEAAVREQVLDPPGLDHTYFYSDEIVGNNGVTY